MGLRGRGKGNSQKLSLNVIWLKNEIKFCWVLHHLFPDYGNKLSYWSSLLQSCSISSKLFPTLLPDWSSQNTLQDGTCHPWITSAPHHHPLLQANLLSQHSATHTPAKGSTNDCFCNTSFFTILFSECNGYLQHVFNEWINYALACLCTFLYVGTLQKFPLYFLLFLLEFPFMLPNPAQMSSCAEAFPDHHLPPTRIQ